MVSAQSSFFQVGPMETYRCEAPAGCAYAIVETGHTTELPGWPDIRTTLPLSIVPSDVMGSLVGSSIPTTLIIDTGSLGSPTSTQWDSSSMSSVPMTSGSPSTITITRTRQSGEEETTVPITTETLTYFLQPSPTATGVITLSTASVSASASAPAGSTGQSAASTKHNVLAGLNEFSLGILSLWGFAFMAAWI